MTAVRPHLTLLCSHASCCGCTFVAMDMPALVSHDYVCHDDGPGLAGAMVMESVPAGSELMNAIAAAIAMADID
jgi:hypothetical protein